LDLTEDEITNTLKITKNLQKKKILRFINEHKEDKRSVITIDPLKSEPPPSKMPVVPKLTNALKSKPAASYKKLGTEALERCFLHELPDYTVGMAFEEKFFNQQVDLEIKKLLNLITTNLPTSRESKNGSIYCGMGGLAYMYFHLYLHDPHKKNYLKTGMECLTMAEKLLQKDKIVATFLIGHAGLYALQAVYANTRSETEKEKNCVELLKSLKGKALESKETELLYGKIGYLYAVQFVNSHLGKNTIPSSYVSEVINRIFSDGQKVGAELGTKSLMWTFAGQIYLGAAHGAIGILLILLSFPLTDAQMDLVWTTLDYFIRDPDHTLRFPNGNWACVADETDTQSDYLVHWCHGAPGMIFLLTKAYEISRQRPQDKKRISPDLLLKEAEAASDLVWERGIVRKGLGLCHGVSGNAYCFLNLFKVTQNPKYIYRARAFASWALDYWETLTQTREMRTPDHPYSLYEGLAGTVCFYSDLIANSLVPPCFPGYEL